MRKQNIKTLLIGLSILIVGIVIGRFGGGMIAGAATFGTITIIIGRWNYEMVNKRMNKGIRDVLLNRKFKTNGNHNRQATSSKKRK